MNRRGINNKLHLTITKINFLKRINGCTNYKQPRTNNKCNVKQGSRAPEATNAEAQHVDLYLQIATTNKHNLEHTRGLNKQITARKKCTMWSTQIDGSWSAKKQPRSSNIPIWSAKEHNDPKVTSTTNTPRTTNRDHRKFKLKDDFQPQIHARPGVLFCAAFVLVLVIAMWQQGLTQERVTSRGFCSGPFWLARYRTLRWRCHEGVNLTIDLGTERI